MSASPTMTAAEAAAGFKAGSFTATQMVEASLARIAAHDPSLGAFTCVTAEREGARMPVVPVIVIPASVRTVSPCRLLRAGCGPDCAPKDRAAGRGPGRRRALRRPTKKRCVLWQLHTRSCHRRPGAAGSRRPDCGRGQRRQGRRWPRRVRCTRTRTRTRRGCLHRSPPQ